MADVVCPAAAFCGLLWAFLFANTAQDIIFQLKGWGMDAIECYYPQYTPEQREFYLCLTEKYNLYRTGGSDFHGEKVKPDIQLARLDLELGWLLEE